MVVTLSDYWRLVHGQVRRNEGYVEDCSPYAFGVLLSSDSVNVVKSGDEGKSFSVRPEQEQLSWGSG